MIYKFMFVALYIALTMPIGKFIQKHIGEEWSRKYGHIKIGPVMWFSTLFILKCDPFWCIAAGVIYTILVTICEYSGLVADQRDGKDDNPMAAFWYGLGMTILIVLLMINPDKWLIPFSYALFTVSHGDALAALVGKKYGKYTMQLPHSKSLAGSIAFVIAAIYGMLIPSFVLGVGLTYLWQMIVLAIVGAIIEIYAGNCDNLLITLAVGFLAFIII